MEFEKRKTSMLASLNSSESDKSPKGSLDSPIIPLINTLNQNPNYFTTSSCSGRISILSQPLSSQSQKKNKKARGGTWLFVSHHPADPSSILPLLFTDSTHSIVSELVFRFEPLIIAIECKDISSAHSLVSLAISSGFRESGITSANNRRVIIAIRCSIRMEVPLGDTHKIMVTPEYVRYLVQVANQKMEANAKRTERFFQLLQSSGSLIQDNNGSHLSPLIPVEPVSDHQSHLANGNTPESNSGFVVSPSCSLSIDSIEIVGEPLEKLFLWGHSACALDDGNHKKVVVYGGFGGLGRHARRNDLLLLDPYSGNLETISTLECASLSPRLGHTASLVGDIDSAKEFKDKKNGSPVEQLCLVDVPIGRVSILALSKDNSMLAASVAGDIRFYSVESFLNKEVKQSFSCSLNESAFVKNMRWATGSENTYLVLSNTGELYHGETGCPLKHVMDSVEAADWDVKGTFVAVARKNSLSILSAKFEERVSIPLSFRSWVGDTETNVSVKVDSVKCVRPDSIIIGCFQITEDGKEENYLIQVISSRLGEFSDVCSELVVQSFYDIYPALIDDISPPGSGPYLTLAYLEQCELVINANMKNTDAHIVLLGWAQDEDMREAAVVNIEREKWVPRIELQENGDDNLLLGLSLDNVSIYQKVEVQVGMEEIAELSPSCVLVCLTLEGKLVLFHIATLAGSKVSPEVDSALHNEEDVTVKLPVGESSTFSHGLQKKEPEMDQIVEVSGISKGYTKNSEVELATNIQASKSDVLQMVPNVDVKQNDSQIISPPGQQQKNLGQTTAALGTSTGPFTANRHSAAPGLTSYKYFQHTTEMQNTINSRDSQKASHPLPGETFSFLNKSDGSSFSAPNYVDSSGYQNKKYTTGAPSVSGNIGGKPFLVKDVNAESPAIYSASRSVQSGGQLTSIGAGSSHLSLNGNTATGNSSIRKFQPSNEQHGNISKLAVSSSDFSKQFGNINDMTKELDQLLNSIEEAGGFRDACTRSLRSSIEAVEQSMDSLSKQCKIWTGQVDQHHEEVHYLLNKTIRVVARKVYMEGIFKQASDSRYMDLWNRQKLNSELELKRQHILSLNQDLTYQLVELERHFNALELNKFGPYGGHHIGRGASQNRSGPSRYNQSLHSLQNAISSQLVAAENLSDCLSKQMEALSLRSQSKEQKNVKELFETIGLPYDASFGSPDMKGFVKTPNKKLLFSDLTTNKDKSRRVQASGMKSCEPEMSRRRRDSLDQSWACSEPPKTIVKRMLLQEVQKPNWKESSLSKEKVKLSMSGESTTNKIDARIPSAVFPASQVKASFLGSHLAFDEVSEQSKAFIQYDNLQTATRLSAVPPRPAFHMSPEMWHGDSTKAKDLAADKSNDVPPRPAFHMSPEMWHGDSAKAKDLAADKSNVVQSFNSISNSENTSLLKKMPQKSSISPSSTTETPSSLIKSSEMPMTNSKMTMATSFTMGEKLSGAFSSESWRKNFPSSEVPSSTISAAPTMVGKVTEFNFDKSWPKNNIPAVAKFSGSSESLSPPTNKTPSISSVSSSVSSTDVPPAAVSETLSCAVTGSNISNDSNHMSTSSASFFLNLSNQAPKTSSSLSNPHCSDSSLESLKSEIQPAAVPNLNTSLDAAAEVVTQLTEPLSGESEIKLGSSIKLTPTNEQSSNNTTISEVKTTSVSQPVQPSDAPLQLSTSFLASASVSSGKNGGLDVGISQEDEMEEEAPETSNATELSLGSLGGFGIGSTPNPSMPKSNPFGGSFNNVATSSPSSSITFSVPSGELFRPASFTFANPQSSAPTQSTNSSAFSGGFGVGAAVPAQAPSAFGQPAQIGAGQQVLGSVLGTFGQSRQLGGGLPGSGFAAPTGFGGGFSGSGSPTGGFSNAAIGGGFAGRTSTGGGFAGMASTGGGFAGITSTGSGFSGFAGAAAPTGGFAGAASAGGGFGGAAASPTGGFAGAASAGGGFGAAAAAAPTGGFAGAGSGAGFGAFSSQGSGGFSAFSNVGGNKPSELFTQMRK